jgi:hypothetical protein
MTRRPAVARERPKACSTATGFAARFRQSPGGGFVAVRPGPRAVVGHWKGRLRAYGYGMLAIRPRIREVLIHLRIARYERKQLVRMQEDRRREEHQERRRQGIKDNPPAGWV